MAEYIDIDAPIDVAVYQRNRRIQVTLRQILESNDAKYERADVRPVVRGKWETVMLDHERMGCRPTAHYCSECHQITWFRTFFCPNCGAMMEES